MIQDGKTKVEAGLNFEVKNLLVHERNFTPKDLQSIDPGRRVFRLIEQPELVLMPVPVPVPMPAVRDGLRSPYRKVGWRAAAQEAGMSRIYGGIHWQFDNVEGLKVGRTLGEYVYRNTLQSQSATRKALYPPVITTK